MRELRTAKPVAALLLALLLVLPACAFAQSAVVDNGSDPGSRLNMRSGPDTGAKSLGKFYSGTQVEIVADAGGGWSQVKLGSGMNTVSGYMKSEYLATGSAAHEVPDATFAMQVTSPYGTQSVVLRDAPSDSYDAVAMLMVGQEVTVIGVSGDFYYVQMGDRSVGCLASDELK